MGTKWEQLNGEYDRLTWLIVVGSVVAGAVAYACLVTAKLVWSLPLDWRKITVGPLIAFGFFFGLLWLACRLGAEEARQDRELQ
jgi:hypothetical protein